MYVRMNLSTEEFLYYPHVVHVYKDENIGRLFLSIVSGVNVRERSVGKVSLSCCFRRAPIPTVVSFPQIHTQ